MTKAQAMKTIGEALNAANAGGDLALAGQLATLYYKVANTDW